jgi:hypothetical protein
MLEIPSERKRLLTFVTDLIEQCRSSVGERTAYYRNLATMVETGTDDAQTKSRTNLMYHHLRRTEAHLFSPIQLQFVIDFEREYPKPILERGSAVGRVLTRDWERNNTDRTFGQGVFEALKYGACLLKQWVEEEGEEKKPVFRKKLVMPWQFAVYKENDTDLNLQSAMVETLHLSMPQVWQRICRLPGANELMRKVRANSARGTTPDDPSNFLSNILSTNQINTSGTIANGPSPGGVAVFSSNNTPIMTAKTDVDMIKFHEVWIKGATDYVTIQLLEPDILIMPYFSGDIMTRKTNALVPGNIGSGLHPYTLIQPNEQSGYFWGRSEVVDLIEPQCMISQTANDARRLFGLQVDKYMAMSGVDGDIDEVYDSMRSAGYMNLGQQGKVTDLTPKFPPETLPYMKSLIDNFNMIGGFPSVLQGEGSAGVRADSHANTLLKTGSPRLRSMSLAVERSCAQAADLTLSLKEVKDGSRYWTKADTMEDIEKTSFLLTDLPEDRRVAVDSHSSSPIFMDDHQQLISMAAKMGWVGAEEGIKMLPFPNQELLVAKYREREASKAKQLEKAMEQFPELGEKIAQKKFTSGKL